MDDINYTILCWPLALPALSLDSNNFFITSVAVTNDHQPCNNDSITLNYFYLATVY